MSGYEDKHAVVVGGTHGIGRAIAEELAGEGATVIATGRRAPEVPGVLTLASDVTSAPDRDALAATVGELDALFVNVGIAETAPFTEVGEEAWDRHFDINAKGAFFTAQRLAPLVRPGGGIVFTTLMAKTASPDEAVYAATKAAVRAFSRVLAAELVARDVRVNTVAPGFIDTPTFGVASLSDADRDEARRIGESLTPMQRLGTAAEVARAAIFLALEATFTTGAELQVDGGLSEIAVSS